MQDNILFFQWMLWSSWWCQFVSKDNAQSTLGCPRSSIVLIVNHWHSWSGPRRWKPFFSSITKGHWIEWYLLKWLDALYYNMQDRDDEGNPCYILGIGFCCMNKNRFVKFGSDNKMDIHTFWFLIYHLFWCLPFVYMNGK